MKPIQIKVEANLSGWGLPWYAYSEELGGIDYDWTGDSWQNCGSPQGVGRTIQDAIEDFINTSWEKLAKLNPDEKGFNEFDFEPPFKWS